MTPKFRTDLSVSDYREADGQKTIVLKEPVTERYYRISMYEYQLLRALDGVRTLEKALELLALHGRHYSPEEARLIVGKAAQFGLVLGAGSGTAKYLKQMKDQMEKAKRARSVSNYYFYSIPLWNPDAFLTKTVWLWRLICNKYTFGLFVPAALGALLLVVSAWPELQRQYLFFFNAQGLLYLTITISAGKIVHEFSHAYCAKSYGLHVPQMGVAVLLFFPCLFCNTTDAWQLADRNRRMSISAAGIGAELVMAVISAYIWSFTQPGILNSLAFYLMTVSLVSTVIFNGNPLIKFDGYFILMDWLQLPNLAAKSVEHVKSLFYGRALGVERFTSPAKDQREFVIFTAYGAGSAIYRVFLYSGMIAGVYYRFDKFLGIMLALIALFFFVLAPIGRSIKNIYSVRPEMKPKLKGLVALISGVLILTGGLCLPWSMKSVYECRICSSVTQKITVPLSASVKDVFIKVGSHAPKDAVLFTLDTEELENVLAQTETDCLILQKEINLLLLDDSQRALAEPKRVELMKTEDHVARLKEKLALASRGIRAPFDGVITALDPRMRPGFQPGEGMVIGEMESPHAMEAQALIPEEDLRRASVGREVKLRLPGAESEARAVISGVRSYSERSLSGSPFSGKIGGSIAVEPKENDEDAPLNAFYTCVADVSAAGIPSGMTGKMVIADPPLSIAARFTREMRKTLRRESLM